MEVNVKCSGSREKAKEEKVSLQPWFKCMSDCVLGLCYCTYMRVQLEFNKCSDFLKSLLTCPTVDLKKIFFAKGKKSIPSSGSPEVEPSPG